MTMGLQTCPAQAQMQTVSIPDLEGTLPGEELQAGSGWSSHVLLNNLPSWLWMPSIHTVRQGPGSTLTEQLPFLQEALNTRSEDGS